MLAFSESINLGVDFIELDIHLSSDNIVVVSHDDNLKRMSGIDRKISSLNYNEIAKINVAHRFVNLDKEKPFEGQNARDEIIAPRLEDFFSTYPNVRKNIDMKSQNPRLVEEFNRLVKKHKQQDKVVVASFFHDTLAEFRKLQPEMAYCASQKQSSRFILGKTIFEEYDALELPFRLGPLPIISKRNIGRAHNAEKQIIAWTVNDFKSMQRLTDWGIDGLITDRPDLAMKVKKSN